MPYKKLCDDACNRYIAVALMIAASGNSIFAAPCLHGSMYVSDPGIAQRPQLNSVNAAAEGKDSHTTNWNPELLKAMSASSCR